MSEAKKIKREGDRKYKKMIRREKKEMIKNAKN